MEFPPKPPSTTLFQVYLRLRPPPSSLIQITPQSLYPLLSPPERYLLVEVPKPSCLSDHNMPTHITLNPPSDSRKRAVEKFAFTKVFEEDATQLDVFVGAGVVPLVEGVLREGRDGLMATLGVTGSGKTHTILGSKTQRGLTQMSLDLLFRSLGSRTLNPSSSLTLVPTLAAGDASEAQILSASSFLEGVYGDGLAERVNSRAPTPMTVGTTLAFGPTNPKTPTSRGPRGQWSILSLGGAGSPREEELPSTRPNNPLSGPSTGIGIGSPGKGQFTLPSQLPFWNTPRITRSIAKLRFGNVKDSGYTPSVPRKHLPQRPSALPQLPDTSDISVNVDSDTEYAILISMYEVYNDRIFDLLSNTRSLKDLRRRPLLFKSTEASPDRKVVAGLRKVVCGNYEEALMVLETGLMERRVAGTGSNSVSSRSHGFFCVEVRNRKLHGGSEWSSSQMTIVDLAGSERARNAKTAGATLAEAGKINESLMYLGQCLQMQSDWHDGTKPSVVPFRQCKLTELLFSNSFPSTHHATPSHHRNPQKAIMIVTADPVGDFNATSQILRYSALAREITVPRIPSVTSTILSGTTAIGKSQNTSGRVTPNPVSTEELEVAAIEIVRLSEEVDVLNLRLVEEENRRREAEMGWRAAEERSELVEQEVREECWSEMEMRFEEEQGRWKGAWGEEVGLNAFANGICSPDDQWQANRNDEHLDKKLEILTRGIQIHEDPEPTADERVIELEDENAALRRKVQALERELQGRSPTKKSKRFVHAAMSADHSDVENAVFKLNGMSLDDKPVKKTPRTKQRKLTTRKWDLGMGDSSP
ncbi:MAG: hypothetical protein M1830_010229 [Pleopsidium flavum]|nr:MAG: hypothetical protein M1830_010229 [Pleopsidium flavum]